MRRPALVFALLTLCLLTASRARGDSADARDLATRAARRILQGDRRGAIAFLEKAYEADPQPGYLFQLAEQYESLASEGGDERDLQLALVNFRLVLAHETDPARAQELQARIQRLQARMAAPSTAPPSTPSASFAAGTGPAAAEASHAVEPPVSTPPPVTVALAPPPARPEAQAAAPVAPVPPPAPPRATPVAVQFLAGDKSESFKVNVGQESCATPCTLQLAPGPYLLRTTGSANRKISLYVRESPGVVRIPATQSKLVLPGLVLVVAGTVVASTMWALEYACPAQLDLQPTACETANEIIWPLLGGAALITGIAFLGSYGAHYVSSVDMELAEGQTPPPGFRLASFGLQPIHNGAAAGAGFAF